MKSEEAVASKCERVLQIPALKHKLDSAMTC